MVVREWSQKVRPVIVRVAKVPGAGGEGSVTVSETEDRQLVRLEVVNGERACCVYLDAHQWDALTGLRYELEVDGEMTEESTV